VTVTFVPSVVTETECEDASVASVVSQAAGAVVVVASVDDVSVDDVSVDEVSVDEVSVEDVSVEEVSVVPSVVGAGGGATPSFAVTAVPVPASVGSTAVGTLMSPGVPSTRVVSSVPGA
jgi:hypothetical protein